MGSIVVNVMLYLCYSTPKDRWYHCIEDVLDQKDSRGDAVWRVQLKCQLGGSSALSHAVAACGQQRIAEGQTALQIAAYMISAWLMQSFGVLMGAY